MCVCAYDGFGYYMYLPHLFQKGDLRMNKKWAKELQNEHCPGAPVYQIEKGKYMNELNIYHMGLSMVMLPSYTIADIYARATGYSRDGFSEPYHVAYHLNALLFIFLGLLYLRKLLLQFTSDKIAALTIGVLYLSSNIYFTFEHQYDLTHLYLFSLNAIWLYHLFQYNASDKKRSLFFSTLIFGLTVCIRPTQAILVIIPLFALHKKEINRKIFWKHLMLFPLLAFVWNIPQMAYWQIIGGSPFILNMHTEDIVLSDPNLKDFLFSYRKGWLIYSPIFIFSIVGFAALYKRAKHVFWAILTSIFIYSYVMASWECWWYASSFGSRAMVDIYPLFAILIAFALSHFKSIYLRISSGIFILFCIVLNLFQSNQLKLGLLSGDKLTKQHYWYTFGKTNIKDFHKEYLIPSKEDLKWPKRIDSLNIPGLKIQDKEIFRINGTLKSESKKDLSITRFKFYDKVSTFESQFEVHFEVKTSNPELGAILKMEAFTGHNNYMWQNAEISIDQSSEEFQEFVYIFNLEWIRHQEDGMQIYVYNPNDVVIEIKDFHIIAHELIRED